LLITGDMERVELYNLETDWAETKEIAANHSDVVKELTEKLNAWKTSLPSQPNEACLSK